MERRHVKNTRYPKILIQQRIIPHYRRRLFERLSSHGFAHVTIAADPRVQSDGLRVLSWREMEHIRFFPAPVKTLKLTKFVEFTWQPTVIDAARRDKPDAIIAEGNPYSLTAWILGVRYRLSDVRMLFWTHGLLKNETGPRWWVRRILYRLADDLLLYGDGAKNILIEKGFDRKRLHVIYNSLDYDTQEAAARTIHEGDIADFRRELGVVEGDGLVAFSGRLQANKRLDLLIEAIARIADRGKRVHAALIGEGGERTKLAALAEARGVTDLVHFLGAAYDEKSNGLVYSASDLCVIPSGAGLTVMHAMAYGTPVLLHDRAGEHFPEWEAVKEGVTGMFYAYGDIESMVRRIYRAIFIDNGRATMSGACKAVIRDRYNPDKQADAIVGAVTASLS